MSNIIEDINIENSPSIIDTTNDIVDDNIIDTTNDIVDNNIINIVEDIKEPELIAKGSFGKVYKYNNTAAIKIISCSILFQNMIEILLMYFCKTDYIQICTDVIYCNNKIGLVQDLAITDIKKYYDSVWDNGNQIPHKTTLKFLKESIMGLNYLHCSGIIHGDVKPNNLLVYEDTDGYYVKITDFGLSRIKTGKSYKTSMFIFRAPEIYDDKISIKSDIWSIGMTFLVLKRWIGVIDTVTRNYYQNMSNFKYILNYIGCENAYKEYSNHPRNINISFKRSESDDPKIIEDNKFYDLLVSMLQYDYNDRPFCSDILN